jgi:hypothetical protein
MEFGQRVTVLETSSRDMLKAVGADIINLKPGSKAQSFLDQKNHVVYKVFSPSKSGGHSGLRAVRAVIMAGINCAMNRHRSTSLGSA